MFCGRGQISGCPPFAHCATTGSLGETGDSMILAAAVVSLSLLVTAAHDIGIEDPASAARMSLSQKTAVLRPLVSSATDCIARSVAADPRLREVEEGDIGDLIVDSMP